MRRSLAVLPWLVLCLSGCTSGSTSASGTAGAPGAGVAGAPGAAGASGAAGANGGAGASGGSSGGAGSGMADGGAGSPSRPDGAAPDAPKPPVGDAGTDATPPGPEAGEVAAVQFYGRWDFTGGKAITVYSGSHVTARFQGTGVSARLDLSHSQNPVTTVTWQIDGGAWSEGDVKATLKLATGLPPGMHDVLFMARGMAELMNRWNPPVVAALSFSGFDVEGGALVPAARPARLKIEFIGDSITEGVRVVPDGTDPQHTNGHLAYPCLTALALGAEWRQVGFGHQGVLQAGHGNVPKAADSFDWVYATVPRDGWVADVVVLNQGTNDRDASPTAFSPEFARYLGVIRKGYPSAKIFVLRPFGGYREVEVAAQTNARIAAGDANMFYVDTTGWLTAADYTEGLHPNIVGHQKATAALVAELRKHL